MTTFKSNTSRDYYAILTVTEKSQSVEANKTTLSYKLVMYSGDYDFSGYTIGYQVKINGKEVAHHDNSGNQTSLGTNSSKTVCSGTTTVTHDSDGTKEDMAVSFKIWMDKTSYLPASDLTKSGTMDLTTIPRATAPSIDLDSVEMGKSIVISMPRKASSFTHTLTYSFAGASGTIGTELGTSKTWTVPLSLADKIPNATSGTLTVTCKTYDGDGDLIGTKTDTVKVTVPATVVPNINDVDITEAVAAVTNAFGDIFLQNLSQLNISVDASGAHGSTIKSYSVKLDGVTYIQQAFTSNVIRHAGELSVEVSVTDSRGRKDSETYKVDIVEYSQPVVTDLSYMHCDQDGTQNSSGTSTKVTISGRVYPVNELNTKALKLLYKAITEEVYTERVIEITDWTFSTDVIINNTDPTVTYEYIATLTDKMNVNSPEVYRITTGVIALSRYAGGKGITLFGEAEEEGFVIKGDNPLKIASEVAAGLTRQNISFIGVNPISGPDEDTPAFWRKKGTGLFYITKTGLLKNQPSQYGLVLNLVGGYDVFHIWSRQGSSVEQHKRAGDNANGWYANGEWKRLYDSYFVDRELWAGTWSSGSQKITGTTDYKVYVIEVAAKADGAKHATTILAVRNGSYVRGIGGYESESITDYTYTFGATLSGDTWTFVGAGYMYHESGGSHGKRTLLAVESIRGLV